MMKTKKPCLDSFGRVGIPRSLRPILGEADESGKIEVNVTAVGDKLIIERAAPQCILCSSENDLVKFKDTNICKSCIEKIKNI